MQKHVCRSHWRRVLGAALGLAGGVSPLFAQQTITPQNSSQRVERYYQQPSTAPAKPLNPLQQPAVVHGQAAVGMGGVHFLLRRVVFTRSALLSQAALEAAVQPYLGHEIDQAGIAKLLGSVNALYVKRRITTARAMIRDGVVKDGVLHVDLVEGRLGQLQIQGARHVHEAFIRRRIHLKPGEVVDPDALRDNLVYLNRTTDLQVKALLEPGQAFGQTNVLLDVAEPDRHSVDFWVDDNGVESTGRLREGVDANLYGLLGVDDKLSADIAHSSGANDGTVSYSIPLTPQNGRLSVEFSRSQINVIDGAFRKIDITGHSTYGAIGYTQPFIATMHWLFSGIGQYAIENSETSIVGQSIADTRTRQITLGASLQHQRDGEVWGITQLVSRLHSDEPMLGKDNFVIAQGSAFYIRRLWSPKWALRADLGWQLSSGKNIPSANLFQIGGLGSVRGYDLGVLSGPRGYYADLELHRSFGEKLDVFAFIDHGTIYSFYPTSKSITGFGPGLLYRYRSWLTVSADVAKPLETVIPDQSDYRIDARVTVHWL